jgi:hypothetical protein
MRKVAVEIAAEQFLVVDGRRGVVGGVADCSTVCQLSTT